MTSKILIEKLNRFEIKYVTGNFSVGDKDFNLDEEINQYPCDFELLKVLNFIIKNISDHNYSKVLGKDYSCLTPLKGVCKDFTLLFYETNSQIKSNYQYLFHPDDQDCPYLKQLILLLIGVSALQEFIKLNLLEPNICTSKTDYHLCSSFFPDSHFSDDSIIDAFGRDGEIVLTNVVCPKLLFLSLMLLFGNSFDKCLTHKWWLLRCMMTHQRMLSDVIVSLHRSIMSLIECKQQIGFLNDRSEPLAEVLFNIECAYIHMYYYEQNIAEKYIISAQNILGLEIKLNVPKKYVIESLLDFERSHYYAGNSTYVIVKRCDGRYNNNTHWNDHPFQKNILNFEPIDGYYHKMFFIDYDNKVVENIFPEEELLLIAYCDLLKDSSNKKNYAEAIFKYLSIESTVWAINKKAIILACETQIQASYSKLTMFRLLKRRESNLALIHNFPIKEMFLYSSFMPLNWEYQRKVSHILMKNDDWVSALFVCGKIHIWEDLVLCFEKLNMKTRAIDSLETQIAIKPSPVLWCLFGQLTKNPDIYQVAWELSQGTNIRSRCYVCLHYFHEKQYNQCVKVFRKSFLEFTCLHPKNLSCFGKAALECEDWDLAVQIYKQILHLDSSNFNAWNNLATIFITQDLKTEACQCFLKAQELKPDYYTFENYTNISAKIGAFKDSLTCLITYLTFFHSNKYFLSNKNNVKTLQILSDAVVNHIPDCHNNPASNYIFQFVHVLKLIATEGVKHCTLIKLYDDIFHVFASKGDYHNARRIIKLQRNGLSYQITQLTNLESDYFENVLLGVLQLTNQSEYYLNNVPQSGMNRRKTEVKEIIKFLALAIYEIEMMQFSFSLPTRIKNFIFPEIKNRHLYFSSRSDR